MSRCFKNNNFEPIKSSKEYTEKKISNAFYCNYNKTGVEQVDNYGYFHVNANRKIVRAKNHRHRLLLTKGIYNKKLEENITAYLSNDTVAVNKLKSDNNLLLTGEKDAEELKPTIKRDKEHENTAFHFSGDIISDMKYLDTKKEDRNFSVSAIQGHDITVNEMGNRKRNLYPYCFKFK